MVRLYAWAAPVLNVDALPDHTWVTSYDSRVQPHRTVDEVIAARQEFWYCWGYFRSQGDAPGNPTGAIGDEVADLATARCLVLPNADPKHVIAAQGTIFRYGRHGVCHQLANQVLYATGTENRAALTVVGARGYWASAFQYGTYGIPESAWNRKRDSCTAQRWTKSSEGGSMSREPDQFETRAREILKDEDPDLLARLLEIRADSRRRGEKAWSKTRAPTAALLNSQNQRMFDRAAELLGPERFTRVFGFQPDQKVVLVEPQLFKARSTKIYTPANVRSPLPAPTGSGHSHVQTTVTLKYLAANLAASHEMAKKRSEAILGDLVDLMVKHLKKGERIRIGGLGVLQVRKRAARMGRNPATGKSIKIKASKKVAFRAAKDLKDAI